MEKPSFFAHKLKSSARLVGANALADLCLALEVAGKSIDWSEIDSLMPELPSEMDLVTDFINGL
ncbi:MAG: Hpt domain-containing protein [Gammaproteobacteria bacterium]|nr:Hpt domain-containing protein [Gammaproteobacteria bacterium]